MLTLYVYDVDTRRVVDEIVGPDNEACEAIAADRNYDSCDEYAYTYTPAFGTHDGLIHTPATGLE